MPIPHLPIPGLLAVIVASSLLAFGPGPSAAATIRVPSAAPTIQAGVDAASPGDSVLVAPGLYTGPGNRNIDFGGKAIRLVSEAGAGATIIDGELTDARGIHLHNNEGLTTLIEGFTIQNFRPTAANISPDGAGMLIAAGCSPLVQSCVFTANIAADGRGGGMYTAGGSVQYCLFDGNGSGGGVPGRGGGVFVDNATLFQCTIRGNWASDFGGTEGRGGGVATPDGAVNRCTIIGNSAGIGAGIFADCPFFSVYLTSSTIAGNFASVNGGGIAVSCAGQADVVLDRCIVWGNGTCGVPDVMLDGSMVTAAFLCSLVDPTSVAGTGIPDYNSACVFEDPLFCDPEECAGSPPFSDGYNLTDDSPARPQNNACNQLMGASYDTCAAAAVGDASAGGAVAPGSPALGRPHPNPAATAVRLALASPLPADARLEIYDVAGRLVRVLLDGNAHSGGSRNGGSILWDLADATGVPVAKGVYFVQLRSAGRVESRVLVVAR